MLTVQELRCGQQGQVGTLSHPSNLALAAWILGEKRTGSKLQNSTRTSPDFSWSPQETSDLELASLEVMGLLYS